MSYLKFIVVLFTFQTYAQQVNVVIPTVKAETDYIWRTIIDTQFFENHNYQVSLPKGQLIETLKEKSKSNTLSDSDYNDLETFVKNKLYNKADYQKGYDKIIKDIDLIHKLTHQLANKNYTWGFRLFDEYTVNLTLYGPGGSYNPDEGSILIYTTPEGQFKGYPNPTNTIIHEIVHIGIEASIVSKYQVPHLMKERIVDTYVYLHFKNYLSDYRIQTMGDDRTDAYLKTTANFKNLDTIVQSVLRQTDKEAILYHGELIRKAFAENDIETITALHHPEVVKALGYNDVKTGRADVIKALEGTLKNFKLEFIENTVESIFINGDTAVEQTKFIIKGTPKTEGEPFLFKGRTQVTYIKDKNSPSGWVTVREIIQNE